MPGALVVAFALSVPGCLTPARVANVELDWLLNQSTPSMKPLETTPASSSAEPQLVVPDVAEPQRIQAKPIAAPPMISISQAAPQPAEVIPRTGEAGQAGPIVAPSASTVQRIKEIRQISLDITSPPVLDDAGRPLPTPADYAAAALAGVPVPERAIITDYGLGVYPALEAMDFCYQPLYFEEVNLERYGQSCGVLQPFISAGAFYGRIPLLPYMMFARPARRCTYHPHWTLPGYRIPCRERHPIVFSAHGAAAETAAVAGLILLIP